MAIYLDYCASTPIDPRVLEAMVDVYQNKPGNADSRTHVFGQQAKEVVNTSRRRIAQILGIDPTEVIFTSGATESDNTAIIGLMNYGITSGKKHIVTTAIEHKAVLEAVRYLEKQGFTVDYVKPDEKGRIHSEDVLTLVRDDTLLVSVMHVNNETGVIQPVGEIGEALSSRDTIFHVDAAQSFGKLNDDLRALKYDMLSISGHKIHGPQGIGALVLKRKAYKRPPVEPLLHGGQQEYGFRPGTTPVALVAGFAAAAEIIEKEYPTIIGSLQKQKDDLISALTPYGVRINGDLDHSLPNVLNFSIPNIDAEAFFAAQKDVYAVSNGSACTSGSYNPSYVLQAMGYDDERIAEALRVSWWDQVINIEPLVQYIRDMQ